MEDLQQYRSTLDTPINITLQNGDLTVHSPSSPSSGPVLEFILNILDGIVYHTYSTMVVLTYTRRKQGRHLRGLVGRRTLPQGKKRKKERKKERKGTMNNVKLLHIKCRVFQFFISPVALKNNFKKFAPPRKS